MKKKAIPDVEEFGARKQPAKKGNHVAARCGWRLAHAHYVSCLYIPGVSIIGKAASYLEGEYNLVTYVCMKTR